MYGVQMHKDQTNKQTNRQTDKQINTHLYILDDYRYPRLTRVHNDFCARAIPK